SAFVPRTLRRADVRAGAGLRPLAGVPPEEPDLKKGDPLPGFMQAVSGVRCSDHRHGWKVRGSRIAPAISKPPASEVAVAIRRVPHGVCSLRRRPYDHNVISESPPMRPRPLAI